MTELHSLSVIQWQQDLYTASYSKHNFEKKKIHSHMNVHFNMYHLLKTLTLLFTVGYNINENEISCLDRLTIHFYKS